MQAIILLVLGAAVIASAVRLGASPWFGGHSHKENGGSTDSKRSLECLLALRGGGTKESTTAAEKIKGVCIGIDLGTTYR